ncbi:MAG: hypothetical protein K9I94_01385 [Bacteroidales bacterium]|nr:hypothetical protein [Bacteroidales bacterium]
METNNNQHECCPPVDTSVWNHKTHEWENKLFIKASIPLFFHMPFPSKVNKVITQLWEQANEAGTDMEEKDFLLLARDDSAWKGHYYLAVDKEIPGADNTKISGTFISRVFDGPYSGIPRYIKTMNKELEEQGKKAKDYYFYYTTCPKCAKKYGHNYIIAFAEI